MNSNLMNQFVLMFTVCVALALAAEQKSERLINDWNNFKATFNKTYKSVAEELTRQQIFSKNMAYIGRHNYEADHGMHTYRLKMNEFGDLRPKEFAKKFFNPKSPKFTSMNKQNVRIENSNLNTNFQNIPSSVDWREKGCVTAVREQSSGCEDLWAFGAAESTAGCSCAKTGKLVPLSAQQLIDCDKKESGCMGGDVGEAYQYIIDNKGIDSAASYPYRGKPGPCKFRPEFVACTIQSYKSVTPGNETDLTIALATYGPIPAGIDASSSSFQFYSSGVYSDPSCGQNIDHILLLAGYGSLGKDDYYIGKNSWGISWGDKGYILVARNKNNMCGISNYAIYPIV